MLEVVENKRGDLRLRSSLKRSGMCLAEVRERSGRGLVRTNMKNYTTIFTVCQMISCKYKYFEWIAGKRSFEVTAAQAGSQVKRERKIQNPHPQDRRVRHPANSSFLRRGFSGLGV
jgi:hypothetical protein